MSKNTNKSHYFRPPSWTLHHFLLTPLLQLLANKTYNLEWDLLDLWDLKRDLLLGPDLEQDLLDLKDQLDLGFRNS